MTKSVIEQFQAARLVSVPLVAVSAADQRAFAFDALPVAGTSQQTGAELPVLAWDAVGGIVGLNGAGREARKRLGDAPTFAFVDACVEMLRLPEKAVVFAFNAHRQLLSVDPMATATAIQAVANLRDQFKLDHRMLVLLGPSTELPSELRHDVVALRYELPVAEQLQQIVREVYASPKPPLPAPDAPTLERCVDALSGLSAFEAEQVTAMALGPDGADVDAMWERKRVTIEQTPGLSVYRGGMRFDDLRGLGSLKPRLLAHLNARTPVGVVVRIDEGSDVFANVEHDTSGNKTDQQRTLLVEMEQNGWRGMILTGVPGTGKSAIAQAFANEAGVPEIDVDFAAMESKWQGESEAHLRQAVDVIKAVGRGHAFFLLTCNSLAGIRPQFMRRFRRGVFFFDLPTAEEREAVWDLYLAKYAIDRAQPRPDDEGWTPSEIRECCESAWDTGLSLLEAARYIIPTSRSRATEIEQMRKEAHGRFLDAGRPGAYHYEPERMRTQLRAIELPAVMVPSKGLN